jgi:ATP-dependent Clp protease ATP-binding subunit ClpC
MVGPTGSGKTYLCKTLAREFFGSEDALIRFDMSEFTEKHEVTKLTGATASYVGYEDTPLLDQVRRKPYSVVLFDEIEKADKAIYQVFLSILDEGFIALGNGVKVDFKNTVIVFTGNVGTKELMLHGDGLGFGKPKTKEEMASEVEGIIMKSIRKTFSPEFINRLSKTIVFNNLDKADMAKICDLELKKLEGRLAERGYSLTVSPEVKSLIVDSCDLKYGARDLQRGIVKYVEEEICTQMLEETDTEGKNKITVTLKKKSDPDSGVKVKFA